MLKTTNYIIGAWGIIAITNADNLSDTMKRCPKYEWKDVKVALERGKWLRSYPYILNAIEIFRAMAYLDSPDEMTCYIPNANYPMALVYHDLAVLISPRLTDKGVKVKPGGSKVAQKEDGRNLGSSKEHDGK
jgi:hypothetical protein